VKHGVGSTCRGALYFAVGIKGLGVRAFVERVTLMRKGEIMTKSDIVEALHRRVGFTKKRSGEVVGLILDLMKEALENGEKVKISGFGNFEIRRKEPRKGRNPQTGEEIIISERRVLTFKASQVLKEKLNES
jgi:integration host factor subunit alpha